MLVCAHLPAAAPTSPTLVQVLVSKDEINVRSTKGDRNEPSHESRDLGHVFEIRNVSGRPLQNLELEVMTEISSEVMSGTPRIISHSETFSIARLEVGAVRLVRTKHYTLSKFESTLPIARRRTGTTARGESKLRSVKATLKENGVKIWTLSQDPAARKAVKSGES
jgi:hypothetical protein